MEKEELEKYINKKVKITIKIPGAGVFVHKGKLLKKDSILGELIYNAYGLKYNDNWYIVALDNGKYYNFQAKVVEEIERLEGKNE